MLQTASGKQTTHNERKSSYEIVYFDSRQEVLTSCIRRALDVETIEMASITFWWSDEFVHDYETELITNIFIQWLTTESVINSF